MRVAVVGGGLIGLCTAHRLARAGADVTVVDRGKLGEECSLANTGWVVPALSAPVAAPGTVKQGITMLLRRDNPFRIKPQASAELARWLMAFRRSAQPARYRAGAAAILALNERTLELFDELHDAGVEFEMHRGGLVFLCLDEGPLAATQQRFSQLGYDGDIERLDGEAVRRLEPSVSEAVKGGLHVKPERFVRPETLTAGLAAALTGLGARLIEDTPVDSLRRADGEWLLDTSGERLAADRVVIAAGIWSKAIARRLGLRLPMQPGKGYSLTGRGTGAPPSRALFFVEAMVGAAPYDGAVRLAGMLELVGMDPHPHARRIGLLANAARHYLSGWQPGEAGASWAGLRPLTPDGLPVVGRVPGHDGVFVASGHGMVGVTLGPATAALLAPLVLEESSAPELEPFRPDRF